MNERSFTMGTAMNAKRSRRLGTRGLVLALVGAVWLVVGIAQATKLTSDAVAANAANPDAMAAYSVAPAPDLGDLLRRLGSR
jgi:hypothetical protein